MDYRWPTLAGLLTIGVALLPAVAAAGLALALAVRGRPATRPGGARAA